MKLNLLRANWLQYNVHYYDRIKFKYGGDDDASVPSLQQLKEQVVESVPRELEAFVFLNQLVPNKEAQRKDVQQQSLANILEMMSLKCEETINSVLSDVSQTITREDVIKLIDTRKIFDWNPETIKKLVNNTE